MTASNVEERAMQLKDKVFLVTGGGSGLGAATATALIEAGAKVVLADVNRAAGEKLAAELGAGALFVETDVTGEASAANAINAAVTSFGALHGLVNCAGVAPAEKVVGKEGRTSWRALPRSSIST
jgi:NAD(P)-dependent dehydrogenase (short-subunit alcohol dehydrogenase family)